MNASEFIIRTIENLTEENPYIKCVYEYDNFDLTHYVKITPKEFFDINGELFTGEEGILKEFVSRFPKEGLLFFSEDDEIELDNPIYKREGIYYQKALNSHKNVS